MGATTMPVRNVHDHSAEAESGVADAHDVLGAGGHDSPINVLRPEAPRLGIEPLGTLDQQTYQMSQVER
jgi:hypothetical protein